MVPLSFTTSLNSGSTLYGVNTIHPPSNQTVHGVEVGVGVTGIATLILT